VDAVTRYCQFCREVVADVDQSGCDRIVKPFVASAGKVYCAKPCWDKLRDVARRTGGVL
jgi:hypothetical protein